MTDQQTETVETETTEPAPTIEELAAQFEVPQSQPVQREQLDNSYYTDQGGQPQGGYIDPDEAMRAQMSQQNSNLTDMNDRLVAFEQSQQETQLQSDINSAVSVVSEILPDVDNKLITGILNAEYVSDKNFAKIWDNRHTNEKAFNQALSTVASSYKGKFVAERDPAAAETIQAATDLMSGSSTTQSSNSSEALSMNNADFDSFFDDLKNA